MSFKLKAVIRENVAAGEFVNTETGEVIKYDAGSLAYVYMPGSDYPDLVKLKGVVFPPKTEGTITLELAIRKEEFRAKFMDFVPVLSTPPKA